MDPSAISQYQRVKNPSVFASTGSWGGTNKGDVWGTFKSVTFVERDQWTKTSQVSRKAEDQW